MNLVIDIGNTRTKIALFNGSELADVLYFDVFSKDNAKTIIDGYPGIQSVIVSSVQDTGKEALKFISQKTRKFLSLNSSTPVPVKNLYQSPETLGNDRLAAVVGANNIYPHSDVLIIDAGTAITYDLINKHAEYLGGNISPGMRMRFRALNRFTGKLPELNPVETFPEIGYNTETSIESGIIYGIVFEINSYIDLYSEKYAHLITILTGGDANFFVKKLKKTIFVIPNLTLTGLNHILQYNEKIS